MRRRLLEIDPLGLKPLEKVIPKEHGETAITLIFAVGLIRDELLKWIEREAAAE